MSIYLKIALRRIVGWVEQSETQQLTFNLRFPSSTQPTCVAKNECLILVNQSLNWMNPPLNSVNEYLNWMNPPLNSANEYFNWINPPLNSVNEYFNWMNPPLNSVNEYFNWMNPPLNSVNKYLNWMNSPLNSVNESLNFVGNFVYAVGNCVQLRCSRVYLIDTTMNKIFLSPCLLRDFQQINSGLTHGSWKNEPQRHRVHGGMRV